MCGFISEPSVPLICASGFVPISYCFGYCSFVESNVRECDTSSFVLFSQDCFTYCGLMCLHTSFRIFCPSSVKNAIGNLIEIALNL